MSTDHAIHDLPEKVSITVGCRKLSVLLYVIIQAYQACTTLFHRTLLSVLTSNTVFLLYPKTNKEDRYKEDRQLSLDYHPCPRNYLYTLISLYDHIE